MKKKLVSCLLIGMSVVMLSGCSIIKNKLVQKQLEEEFMSDIANLPTDVIPDSSETQSEIASEPEEEHGETWCEAYTDDNSTIVTYKFVSAPSDTAKLTDSCTYADLKQALTSDYYNTKSFDNFNKIFAFQYFNEKVCGESLGSHSASENATVIYKLAMMAEGIDQLQCNIESAEMDTATHIITYHTTREGTNFDYTWDINKDEFALVIPGSEPNVIYDNFSSLLYDGFIEETNVYKVLAGNSTSAPQTTQQTPTANTKTQSYLTADAEKTMQTLNTDYSKINWGVRYNPGTNEGIVISISPFFDDLGSEYLLIGITNIYNQPITIKANGYAKGQNGENVGDISMYIDTLGAGSTYIQKLYCKDLSDGSIHWDEFLPEVSNKEYVYWEADYTGKTSGNDMIVDYAITASSSSTLSDVQIVGIDENGNIVDVKNSYSYEKDKTLFEGNVTFYGGAKSAIKDVAIFANPIK